MDHLRHERGFRCRHGAFPRQHDLTDDLPRRYEWVDRLGSRPSGRWRDRRLDQWARDICGPSGAGAARAKLWRVASRSTQPEYRATRLPGDDTPPDAHAGHCADGGDRSDSPPPRPLAAQREVLQRRWTHDRWAGLNVRLRGGDWRLVNPPAGTGCCVAAQAPAGGVAEGARCSIESRIEIRDEHPRRIERG